jgi:hypothetical protein
MKRKLMLCLCALLVPAFMAVAAEKGPGKQSKDEQDAKQLSGMSIVGNDEAPKSLYIVPWKSSEIGVETTLDMMLNKDAVPVDRDVFKRQIDFYEVSTSKRPGRN